MNDSRLYSNFVEFLVREAYSIQSGAILESEVGYVELFDLVVDHV